MQKRPNAYREGRVSYKEDEICYAFIEDDQHAIEDELEKKREAKIRRRAKPGAAPKKPLATRLNPDGYLTEYELPALPNFQGTADGYSTTETPADTQSITLHERGDELMKMPDVIFPKLFRNVL